MIERLLDASRLQRIIVVGAVALAVVLAIFALVDKIYINLFYTPDTVIVPSYVSVAVGAVMYVWGWMLFVGTRAHTPRPTGWWLWAYVLIATSAVVIDVVLLIQGFSMTDMIAG
jgi:hypothetical protein